MHVWQEFDLESVQDQVQISTVICIFSHLGQGDIIKLIVLQIISLKDRNFACYSSVISVRQGYYTKNILLYIHCFYHSRPRWDSESRVGRVAGNNGLSLSSFVLSSKSQTS